MDERSFAAYSGDCSSIGAELRPKYLALTTERFVLDEISNVYVATASIYPDVGVVDTGAKPWGQGGVATAAPIRLATVVPTRVPHVVVEILETASRRLVTAIEVLSPTNKRSEGREEYLAKRRRILLSTAHLIEIDLLHKGKGCPCNGRFPTLRILLF